MSWGGRVKYCPRCREYLRLIPGVTFTRNRNRSVSRDGFQIFCRECDGRRKATEIPYGWSVFLRVLEKERVDHLWTPVMYEELVRLDECRWCGAHLTDWGKGHNVDRINSQNGHVPNNCVPCCSACNHAKSHMGSSAWLSYINGLLTQYGGGDPKRGRGLVDWEDVFNGKGPRRAKIPNLREYVVERQLTLVR